MLTVLESLAEAAQREPELASYYEFQGKLFEMQEKTRGEISARLELADQEALQAHLLQGAPLLAFAQLPLRLETEARRFAGLATVIAQALKEYYAPEGNFPPVTREGTEGRLDEHALLADVAEWVSLAQRRFEESQAGPGQQGEEKPPGGMAEVAADLALRPYLRWAAEQVLLHVDQERWKRAYCPVCGGEPDFAFLEEDAGARRLMCSRCSSQWFYRRVGCPFCRSGDHAKIVYYPSEDEVYRLYVCKACNRYLKTLDLRKTIRRQVLPEVERITTVAMDAAAQQEGYC